MKEYVTPDFDVTIYEVEDIISANLSIGTTDPDGGDDSWFG